MRRLLIDDCRTFRGILCFWGEPLEEEYPGDYFHEVRTYEEGIKALEQGGWDELYLDNDLGNGSLYGSGFHILQWLFRLENRHLTSKIIICVSGNPDAVKRMVDLHKSLTDDGRLPEGWKIYTKSC